MSWNTVLSVWYIFLIKNKTEEKNEVIKLQTIYVYIKDQISKHRVHNLLCLDELWNQSRIKTFLFMATVIEQTLT